MEVVAFHEQQAAESLILNWTLQEFARICTELPQGKG